LHTPSFSPPRLFRLFSSSLRPGGFEGKRLAAGKTACQTHLGVAAAILVQATTRPSDTPVQGPMGGKLLDQLRGRNQFGDSAGISSYARSW
jgi:hypothetical protein